VYFDDMNDEIVLLSDAVLNVVSFICWLMRVCIFECV
jgi:hypothetical protein